MLRNIGKYTKNLKTTRDGINKRKCRFHGMSRFALRLDGFVRYPMYVAVADLGLYHFVSEP